MDLEKDDIVAEQLTRNIQFFGKDGQKKINDAFVVVVGLGVSASPRGSIFLIGPNE